MKGTNDSPEEKQVRKPEPFTPGTPAWGLWLARQAHVGHGLCPTVAGTGRKIAIQACKIVSPGYQGKTSQ